MARQPASSPAPAREAIIRTRQLTKQFGNEFAVRNVSFDVPHGAIFGFIGPSGSGKTTTIRMLTGYYPPSSGEVFVFGKSPAEFGQSLRARIGYMPQLFVLYPHLSVWENLNFAASIYGLPLFRRRMVGEVLTFVELNEHRNKLARDISGGMQRRLSLAATLLHRPELIFLDEPTAGIDPVLRQKFWDHFRSLRENGRTLFITTQYVSEAAYCDLVGVMAESELIAFGTPADLRYKAYGGDMVDLRTAQPLDYRYEYQLRELPFVTGRVTRTSGTSLRLVVDRAATAIPDLLEWTQSQGVEIETVEQYQPPFDDVFVELVRRERANG